MQAFIDEENITHPRVVALVKFLGLSRATMRHPGAYLGRPIEWQKWWGKVNDEFFTVNKADATKCKVLPTDLDVMLDWVGTFAHHLKHSYLGSFELILLLDAIIMYMNERHMDGESEMFQRMQSKMMRVDELLKTTLPVRAVGTFCKLLRQPCLIGLDNRFIYTPCGHVDSADNNVCTTIQFWETQDKTP